MKRKNSRDRVLSKLWSIVAIGCFCTLAIAEEEKTDVRERVIVASRLKLDGKTITQVQGELSDNLKFYCLSKKIKGHTFTTAVPEDGLKRPPEIAEDDRFDDCSSVRFVSRKNDVVRIYLFRRVPKDDCNIKELNPLIGKETLRRTALTEELRAIVKFIGAKAERAPSAGVDCFNYWGDVVIQMDRSTLVIEANESQMATPSEIEAKSGTGVGRQKSAGDDEIPEKGKSAEVKEEVRTATTKEVKKDTPSVSILTGPSEHVFLSGDVLIKGAKQLKYDSNAKTITEKEKPSQIYLGINYMFGDLYTPYDSADWHRFVIKGLVSASSSPFDSYGVGIGYRFAERIFDPNAKSNSGFVLFVGSFWTKGDQETVDVDGSRKKSWRVGLSYSVGTALDWLK
jgi:hypothetical protein